MKLVNLLPEIKSDFAAVCKAFNVDIEFFANEAVKTKQYPIGTMFAVWNQIVIQKEHDDKSPVWEHRKQNGMVGRVIPFVQHDWLSRFVYDHANDAHIETLLKRVLVSFANPDLH